MSDNATALGELFWAVETMREAQTAYFKKRDKTMLQRSILLEQRVDSLISRIKEEHGKEST
jgi:hypothetical protein